MEIRNDAEALKAFLGVSSTAPATGSVRSKDAGTAEAAFAGDQATFSQAATEVSQTTDESAVRKDRVTAVQQALASGTYNVPSTAVAGKVIDAMLGGGLGSGN
jgi:negative regulator of flagellin synthesis FlgM